MNSMAVMIRRVTSHVEAQVDLRLPLLVYEMSGDNAVSRSSAARHRTGREVAVSAPECGRDSLEVVLTLGVLAALQIAA
jgi:hypothetical protein